ncbi:MAG TPA: hypothetical protein VKA15_12740 [Isosphaeraceae bacterium]|nr:hypothetical protein [Isosphaeraceae bacterium]
MQLERFVRTSGLLLVLGLAGLAGGCGPGTQQGPTNQEEANEIIRKEHKESHQLKADAKKIQGASRKGEHRGQGGR